MIKYYESDSIKYIGVNDRDIDLFEGQYVVPEGMAYNSYVILDEKIAIMDTVDGSKTEEWLANLEEKLAGKTPEILVCLHTEPDHAGSIGGLLDKYPEIKVVGNAKTFNILAQFLNTNLDDRKIVVKEGDVLDLGEHKIHFVMAPMVHWPEVMFGYEETEKILFAADAFGKFGATDADEDWDCEARRYYFNIVGKYGVQVQAVLKKAAGLDIKTICSLHGPTLTGDLSHYINLYDTWSKYEAEDEGVMIAYASIHGNTAKAAKLLAEKLEAKGVKVAMADLARDDMAEAVEDAFRYDRLVLAASSYDGGVFPPMEFFLVKLKAKNFQNRKVAIMENGSWAPSAAKTIKGYLEQLKKLEIVEPTITIKSAMNDENIAKMDELVEALV